MPLGLTAHKRRPAPTAQLLPLLALAPPGQRLSPPAPPCSGPCALSNAPSGTPRCVADQCSTQVQMRSRCSTTGCWLLKISLACGSPHMQYCTSLQAPHTRSCGAHLPHPLHVSGFMNETGSLSASRVSWNAAASSCCTAGVTGCQRSPSAAFAEGRPLPALSELSCSPAE